MHPFCCVTSTVNSEQNLVGDPVDMPVRSEVGGERETMSREASLRSFSISSAPAGDTGNGFRTSTASDQGRLRLADFSMRGSLHENYDLREVKLNNIVGSGISGILYKWVNYGKGWRPRWFVLQDGVLSYYKIHGPDKIEVNQETEKGAKVIGEVSYRRMSKRRNGSNHQRHNHHHQQNNHYQNGDCYSRGKPVGEVHLKVSSIRESKSDDKRFSIFTGTKRLHLRAETREDRVTWVEALQAVKDLFPRMSNSELMAPLNGITISTEKLRQRLLEEGLNEASILDCEQIMRTEFSTLQNQLILLKQKQSLLLDSLRQLELTPYEINDGSCRSLEVEQPRRGPVRHPKL
ncbi:oxysterol-binding protein-related protein 1C-like isoform X7 [Nymphaea colorata]|uniref:oxysterol-binding protein-related protein 1C-like isoform X7 n=1 Tax=Nymphaea colorata TaxID=210225 RepID=UPI00129E4978|nr:oxysterol-binding protein-related protein 1C-like isoform X7 [Nymphaea colorata]